MSDHNSATGGTNVVGLLGVAFIVLKLCGVIDWPWIWVLAPFWIGIALAIVILAGFGITLLVLRRVGRRR